MNLPSIWRALTISSVFEDIIVEIRGNLIVVHNAPSLGFIFERALKQVQWTIVFIGQKIFKVVFEWDSKLTTFIILSNFELEIFEISIEILMCPSLFDIPIFAAAFNIPIRTFDNNSLIRPLIFFYKFFNSKGF